MTRKIKIRKDGIEFLIVGDVTDDEERFLFCRKTPKNRFVGLFAPWRQMRQAYEYIIGYRTFYEFSRAEKIIDRINTWEDFLEWRAEQKASNDAKRLRNMERWNSLKQK
jgi:hypothetical protein